MPATVSQIRNSLSSERRQMSEAALMYSDVHDALRDCEEKVALLLKDCDDDAAFEILAKLEDIKGIAGGKQMENA